MSRAQEELALLARAERERAWLRTKELPKHAGEVLKALPRRHPWLAMGAAAWLAMSFAKRRNRKAGIKGKPSSWLGAIAALGVRILPDFLRVATRPKPEPDPDLEPLASSQAASPDTASPGNHSARGRLASS